MDTQSFVVMERGSRWPAHVNRRGAGCVAVKQAADEIGGELLARTCHRAEAAVRGGRHVELAVLSCNDDDADGALQRRVSIARALLATIVGTPNGRLVLAARPDAPAGLRNSLLGVAASLTESLGGTSASVSVCFA